MCWTSESKPIKETAKENIPIYKICRGRGNEIRAYFYTDCIYTLNRVYKQDKQLIVEEVRSYFYRNYTIDKAFHSYLASCEIRSKEKGLVEVCHTTYRSYFLIKVIGYIPIGATYYVNGKGEVVSDKIVLTNCIDI